MPEKNELLHILQQWAETSVHASMRAFIRHNREMGLSMSQVNCLFRLYHKGATSVNDLADHLGITKAAVSQLLDRLVSNGLILRNENPHDRRSKQILLTENGQESVQESIRARLSWVNDLAAALDTNEQALVMPALKCLVSHFNQEQSPFKP